MRKIFKLMMSVVAMSAVVGCTTDATEDLSVKVGGKTQLTLSFDDTRTQLGVKGEGETTYPLTWSENDQVSVNGIASDELTVAEGAGTAKATFAFGGELKTPYCVAFPAAAEGQVMFAAEQNHTSNTTFDSKAAVMYGYSKNGENIKLKHLTGILKIGLSLESTAKIMTVRISTIDRKPIAGAFNLNFETGELTPVEGETSSVITYNLFDENGDAGLDLSMCDETPYIHIAVPAGVYDELYITLVDEKDDVMYKTVKAHYNSEDDDKSLKPGKVREFTNTIKYEAISSSESFVISDFSSLVSFKETIEAAQAVIDNAEASDDEKAAATATLSKNAIVVNDLLITPSQISDAGGKWDGINAANYTGTINGNGYQISGLPTPLFNKTAASFKGLHLVANIEETLKNRVGALACQLIATTNAPTVENCSVSGSVSATVDFKPATEDVMTDSGIAGLVGHAAGVTFKNCTNEATISLNQLSTTTKTYAPVAGIVGSTSTANELYTQFTNCHNSGAINCYDTTGKLAPCLAGIVGYYAGENANTTFDNCSNSGNITIYKDAKVRDCNVGGIVGYSSSSKGDVDGTATVLTGNLYFTNNTSNSGNILFEGTASAAFRPGGIIGYLLNGVKARFNGPVTNSGSFTMNGSYKEIRGGGILGTMYSSCGLYINKGAKNTKTATMNFNGTTSGNINFGGIYGYNEYNSTNYSANGCTIDGGIAVRNDADFTINGSVGGVLYLAGFYGFSHNTTTTVKGKTRIINTGKMHVTDKSTITSNLYLGGCLGYANGNRVSTETTATGQMVNKGEIRFEGTAKGVVYIGGIYGCHYASITIPVINTGNIYATGKFNTSKTIRVGGIIGNTTYSVNKVLTPVNMRNATVHCDVVAFMTAVDAEGNYTFTPYNQVGMFVGWDVKLTSDTKNNKVGGRIATTATVENGKVVPTYVDITADNFLTYIRGYNGAVSSGTYFTYLASKDNIAWGSFAD